MKKTSMVQNVLSFFQRIENSIWGEQIVSNKYFASLSIILVALIGALVTGGKILNSTFDLDIEVSFYSAITTGLVIAVLNIYESIIAAENAKIAILRSLLVFGMIVAAFFVGVLTSVVLAIIIAITLAILLLIVVLKGGVSAMTDTSSNKDNSVQNDTSSTEEETLLSVDGEMGFRRLKHNGYDGWDDLGDRWHKNLDGSWSKED